MPTEPTQMISGDVMELQHLIYAERQAHAAEVARLRVALNTLPCACKRLLITTCPQCGGRLEAVTYPSDSMLNRDQFDSVRAGDWYCTNCKGVEARSGYKYWWHSDLAKSNQQCPRCAALAAPPTAAAQAVEGMRKALEAQPCRCSLLLQCPRCAGDVAEGVDQFSGSWICGACVKAVTLPKDPAYPCIRCAALAAYEEAIRG